MVLITLLDLALLKISSQVLSFSPNIANCYYSLGEALLTKCDKKRALKNYKKALELNS